MHLCICANNTQVTITSPHLIIIIIVAPSLATCGLHREVQVPQPEPTPAPADTRTRTEMVSRTVHPHSNFTRLAGWMDGWVGTTVRPVWTLSPSRQTTCAKSGTPCRREREQDAGYLLTTCLLTARAPSTAAAASV